MSRYLRPELYAAAGVEVGGSPLLKRVHAALEKAGQSTLETLPSVAADIAEVMAEQVVDGQWPEGVDEVSTLETLVDRAMRHMIRNGTAPTISDLRRMMA